MRLRHFVIPAVWLSTAGALACAADEEAPARAAEPAAVASAAAFDVDVSGQDTAVFRTTLSWASEQRLDTLAFGDLIVAVGRRFLGAPYVAGSLDPPGPERIIINLRAFDCVTYVESVLALSRVIRDGGGPDDFDRFVREIARLRYRDGETPAYVNRLHYFSEWISANAAKGLVEDVTAGLGGARDTRPIGFMSANAPSYPQLSDASHLEAIKKTEAALNAAARYRIAEGEIAKSADGIRDGDVIAATSAIAGLDIAHTGIAVRIDGRVHLMHAPLAGGVVEISERPLAERIPRLAGQDGIMVARPR